MQHIFLYASSKDSLNSVKRKLMDAFKGINLLPTFVECINCEDSFKEVKSLKFDAYIFHIDGDEFEYFSTLLNIIPPPTEKNKRIKLLFKSLSKYTLDTGAKVVYEKERGCFSVDKDLLNDSKEALASILKFIFFPPVFFFPMATNKESRNWEIVLGKLLKK